MGVWQTQIRQIGLWGALLLGFASSAFGQPSGTYNWTIATSFYPGLKYAHIDATSPRTMQIDALQIDVTTPTLRFYTTPRCGSWVENSTETQRQTTRNFVAASQTTDKKVVAAINADLFDPYLPYDSTSLTNLQGLDVSDGVEVSPGVGTSSFQVSKLGVPSIVASTSSGYDIANVQTAVSGFTGPCLNGGTPVGVAGDTLNPRTGIGVSQDSRYVYFLAIDGRQSASDGAYIQDVGSWLKYFGAYAGVNMDGGGSTTMAWWNPTDKASELLNVPVGYGAYQTNTERCNGNSIGVYYVAAEPSSAAMLVALAAVATLCVLLRGRRREKWSAT